MPMMVSSHHEPRLFVVAFAMLWFSAALQCYFRRGATLGQKRWSPRAGKITNWEGSLFTLKTNLGKCWRRNQEALMAMSPEEWPGALTSEGAGTNYVSAGLRRPAALPFEGDGKSARLIGFLNAFFDGIQEATATDEDLLGGRSYESPQKGLAAIWRKAGLAISFP